MEHFSADEPCRIDTRIPVARNTPKHSGPGIASCILSIVAVSVLFMLIIVAGVIDTSAPGGLENNPAGALFLGMMILGGLTIDIAALFLGIAGLYQHNRKKLAPLIGTALSIIVLIIIGSLMVSGILSG
jgi:hypothetical protein